MFSVRSRSDRLSKMMRAGAEGMPEIAKLRARTGISSLFRLKVWFAGFRTLRARVKSGAPLVPREKSVLSGTVLVELVLVKM